MSNALITLEGDFALLETGFTAANILLHASAIGLGCHFQTPLSIDAQTGIRQAAGIPLAETPQVVISLGSVVK